MFKVAKYNTINGTKKFSKKKMCRWQRATGKDNVSCPAYLQRQAVLNISARTSNFKMTYVRVRTRRTQFHKSWFF